MIEFFIFLFYFWESSTYFSNFIFKIHWRVFLKRSSYLIIVLIPKIILKMIYFYLYFIVPITNEMTN